MKKSRKILICLGILSSICISVFVIPVVAKKIGSKLYKKSTKGDKIDFDNLGPKIVKKHKDSSKENEKDEY